MSRLAGRLALSARVARRWLGGAPKRAVGVERILIAHRLLLGDTLMLTPLVKKLRTLHPRVEIHLAMQPAFVPLFATRPYDVIARPLDLHRVASVRELLDDVHFDLAFVPGDNRHSWLAYSAGARQIIAHAGDRPAWKNWPLTDEVPYSATPAAWADMVAMLAPGPAPTPYVPSEWPAPPCRPFARPSAPYVVLHVGASNVLRTWFADRWRELAQQLRARGMTVVLSAGASEIEYAQTVDPEQKIQSFAGALDLPQLWHLLAGARLLICPDTGIAHLGRLTGTCTIALFGQGSPALFGAGDFWRDAPFAAVGEVEFPCRDQHRLFRREVSWVNRCDRRPPACLHARCMEGITVERVLEVASQRGWC